MTNPNDVGMGIDERLVSRPHLLPSRFTDGFRWIYSWIVLRKLGAYPCQNALAIVLRDLGKLERTLFLLEYIRDVELRRRIHIGLNKGEARNAPARAMFFNRLGELRDRTLENQQHRASA